MSGTVHLWRLEAVEHLPSAPSDMATSAARLREVSFHPHLRQSDLNASPAWRELFMSCCTGSIVPFQCRHQLMVPEKRKVSAFREGDSPCRTPHNATVMAVKSRIFARGDISPDRPACKFGAVLQVIKVPDVLPAPPEGPQPVPSFAGVAVLH